MAKMTTKMSEAVQDFKSSSYGPAALVIGVIALFSFGGSAIFSLFQ